MRRCVQETAQYLQNDEINADPKQHRSPDSEARSARAHLRLDAIEDAHKTRLGDLIADDLNGIRQIGL